jgi:excisionase family DNA binding protein
MAPKVFTPKTLAKEWGCSDHHIRTLIHRGELRAFKLGGKLLRIRAEDVEEFLIRNSTLMSDPPPQSTNAGAEDARAKLLTRARIHRIRQGWRNNDGRS